MVSLGGLHELLRHGSQHARALAQVRYILPEVEGHAVHHHQLDLLCSRRCQVLPCRLKGHGMDACCAPAGWEAYGWHHLSSGRHACFVGLEACEGLHDRMLLKRSDLAPSYAGIW